MAINRKIAMSEMACVNCQNTKADGGIRMANPLPVKWHLQLTNCLKLQCMTLFQVEKDA